VLAMAASPSRTSSGFTGIRYDGHFVLRDFHKSHLFFLSLCIGAIRGRCCVFCLTRLHIEVAFTSSLLRDSRKIFGEQPLMDTNRHEGGGPEKPLIVQITRIWERSPRRPCLKAWPSLPSVAAASSPKQSSSPRSTRRCFESGKEESRKRISEIKDKGHRGDRARAGAKRISNPLPFLVFSFPDSKILVLSGFDIRPSAFSTHR